MSDIISDQLSILVDESEQNIRIDKFLSIKLPYSRTYIQFLMENQLVQLNGAIAKKRILVQAGDEIDIAFIATPEIELTAENIPLSILYEDEDIIAINKPPGMVVHPAIGNRQGTLVNALLYHCASLADQKETIRPGIVHRLDKDTSGIILAAKNIIAQQKLVEQFANRKVHKEYLAICLGNVREKIIEEPIGRDRIHRQRMTVTEQGKPASTRCEVVHLFGNYCIARLLPKTGRTHQIRVHMQFNGTPIIGDTVYGNKSINEKLHVGRQMLHAHKLQLHHPITGEPIKFIAPLPDDMLEVMRKNDLKYSQDLE